MAAIIDHLGVNVRDFQRSVEFYKAVFAPLGIELVGQYEGKFAGFGKNKKPDFWISSAPMSFQTEEQARTNTPVHVCFKASSRAEVDAFHKAALAAGAKDYGAPGVRTHYHPNYYGAFALDPDGHNIEAVFHGA